MRLRRNYLRALLRGIALVIWIITMPLVFLIVKACGSDSYRKIPHLFHQGTCRILGIRVTLSGDMSQTQPTLYISNHISYIDIFVLGFIPAFFIAKSEVASWPVFGQLARFQNTLFIERKAAKAKSQLKILRDHLKNGNSLILFPEGTSTEGVHVEPFKSTLFAAADMRGQEQGLVGTSDPENASVNKVAIQAVTVAYTHYNGDKIKNQQLRDNYAWYAKMPFLSHFLNLFPLKKVDAKVHFHPVCYLEQFATRKECAEHCHQQVSQKLNELVS